MSTARFNTLQNAAGSKSVPVDTVVDGSAKAWVNFNGSTAVIASAFNVSSVTDNGTCDYTVNFTTAMPDANYIVVGFDQYQRHCNNPTAVKTTTQHRMNNFANDANGVPTDLLQGWFVYFR